METIQATCPQCARRYTLRAELAGRQARCKECGTAFRVPSASAAGPATNATETVLTCRWCGFGDTGNFCSRCGGRLQGDPLETLSACLVPEKLMKEMHRVGQEQDNAGQLEAAYAAEELNRSVLQVADALRRKERWGLEGLLSRGEVETMLGKLAALPGISDLRVAVWTLVSDLERKAAELEQAEEKTRGEERMAYLAGQARVAVQAGSLARAQKYLHELRELAAPAELLKELDGAATGLEAALEVEAARKAYAKLEEKAAKLAFLGEHKKAAKAWQECLFWLSRNAHPDKATLEQAARGALGEAGGSAETRPVAQAAGQGDNPLRGLPE